ncbi:hypothetical protein GCM10023201_06410 [Actinomycetospora corticicola]|uniref:O-antigen/teichoic acid export membrane protein n=1 Tax=Actinomycetospora corticicola TaxID=663602 RepID=A0A7Y9DSQ1_9PSEU|nr:hypothetical protein [Actinomycetospora corticicola]NYD34710.1 hypothetical protein [Actinomycetospora corticicola]
MSSPRRAALGVADQAVSSATNYLTAFVASFVLLPESFGAFVVAFAVVTVLAAATRAVLSEPLIAHLPAVASADRRARLAGSALGAAAVFGLAGTALVVVLGLVGGEVLSTLLVFAPWILGAIVVDAGRYVLLARLRTGATLAVDAAWALAQGVGLGVVALVGSWTPAALAACWGVGALAGLVVVVAVGVERPGRPGPWLREGRYLSGWFTVVSILGQVQMYAVLLLAGIVVSTREMAGLRAVQLLVLQPPTTFMAAVLVLATAMFARYPVAADGSLPPGFAALRRRLTLAMAGLGVLVLVAIPLRDVLMGLLFPRYVDFAPLVPPTALLVAVLGLGVPAAAALRGMRRGGLLCAIQVLTSLGMVGGATVGLLVGGVLGLCWGMVVAATGIVAVQYVAALRARPRAVEELAVGTDVVGVDPVPLPDPVR